MKKVICLILALVMALSLVACSRNEQNENNGNNGNNGSEVQGNGQGNNQGQGENGNSVDDEKRGGTLNIAITADATGIAAWTIAGNTADFICCWPMIEGLFSLNSDGAVVCWLADSYESDAEAKTYTIKLKDNVFFSDGSKLTAEVAKWNLDTTRERSQKATNLIGELESVDVIDDLTIRLNLSQWNSTLLYGLARECGYMYSKEAYDTLGEEAMETSPVGTGPFVQTEWQRDIKHVYKRNENYWNGDVYLDGVTISVYQTGLVAQAALESSEVDVWYNADFSVLSGMEEKGYTVALGSIYNMVPILCYNSTNEDDPFYDIRVRQAVSYAIDTETIAKTVYYGYANARNQFCVGDYYESSEVKGYPYDPAKAKELLAEAGYPNGFDTTITTLATTATKDAVTIIKEQLAEVGINVEINTLEMASYVIELTGWKSGMLLHPSGSSPCIPTQLASMFCQGLSGTVLGLSSMIRPDSVDQNLRGAISATNDEEQLRLLSQAQVDMVDTYCMYKPVAEVPMVFVKSPKLHDDGINEACFYSCTLNTAWKEK